MDRRSLHRRLMRLVITPYYVEGIDVSLIPKRSELSI